MNECVMSGRIGRDPELKKAASGTSCCFFSLAVRRNRAKEGEQNTDWFEVKTFGSTAEFVANYAEKGDLLIVKGPIQIRQYQGRDGSDRTAVEIYADSVEIAVKTQQTYKEAGPSASVRGKPNTSQAKKRQAIPAATPDEVAQRVFEETGEIIEPDDLPF